MCRFAVANLGQTQLAISALNCELPDVATGWSSKTTMSSLRSLEVLPTQMASGKKNAVPFDGDFSSDPFWKEN